MISIDICRKSCKYLAVLTALLLLVSCANKEKGASKANLITPEFPVPPEMMTDPEARASYIMDNVWEKIEVVDSASFESPQLREQFLVDFFAVGNIAKAESFVASMKTLFAIATPAMDSILLAFNDDYISHPNSPMYNLDQYYKVLAIADEMKLLDEASKVRYEDGYKLFLKNRVGQVAEDFDYITPDGTSRTLKTTAYQGDLLLVFYNPDCQTCVKVLEYLGKSERILAAIKNNSLSVLCIYAENDEEAWLDNLNKIPDFASVGMNSSGSILTQSLYDLKASPTLYLLDNEQKVIMKDLFPDQLEDYLASEKE